MTRIRAASLPAPRWAPLWALLALVALFTGAPGALAQASQLQFPKLTGRVVDAAGVIPADEEARLTQKLEALETQSRRQLVVATVPSLEGYEISDYANQLFRDWKLGDKSRNDGVLLIVAPNERKVRIEVGYGMEPIITDGLSFLITNNEILPRFKAGDMPGGIEAGADALIKQLALPPDQAQKIAAQADQQQRDGGGDLSIGTVIFILFVIFFFVLPILRSMGGGRRRSGGFSSPIIWLPGMFGGDDDDHGGWGGFGGGGGGFGGGGGGFSGGGGSSGGGGASGSW